MLLSEHLLNSYFIRMDQKNGAEDKPMENSFKHIYTDEIYGRLREEFRHLNGTTYLGKDSSCRMVHIAIGLI